MYYNLAAFGEKLRNIREKLHLTQKQAADMAYVDERTLRRTEQGQVIPKLETLEALSVIYKTDLVSAIIESRINDYSILLKMQRGVDLKLINEETLNFDNELKILEEMSNEIENEYYRMIITREYVITLQLFTERTKSLSELLTIPTKELIPAKKICFPILWLCCITVRPLLNVS